MSRRIFVNTFNPAYKRITTNAKGFQFGLGVPTELTDEERIELGQQAYEIYFSKEELQDKKRKIQILFDSLTDPKFFGDGAVKVDKVKKYITELELTLRTQSVGATDVFDIAEAATNIYGGAVVGLTGAVVGASAVTGTGAAVGLGSAVASGAAAALPLAIAVVAISSVFSGIAATRQSGREDNAASWKMTRADFPSINSQAIQNSSTRRSIERLYDDRSGQIRNVSTQEAIALLVRETLADALFSTSVPSGTAIVSTEHPGPNGNGDRNSWKDKDALARHFPFKEETSGVDKVERTYVNALLYIKNYIDLIDTILSLRQQNLSRSPDTDEAVIDIPLRISLSTANVQLFNALADTARKVIREKTLTFFDQDREYKTLLNFGNDRQYVAEAWRLTTNDSGSVQLKLTRPLDTDISVETRGLISREIATSVIDVINFEFSPTRDTTPYLRPPNTDNRSIDSKMLSTNTTLTSLGLGNASTGEVDGNTLSYGDTVFRRWFTGDFKSSELNIDFTNYSNFVHFGSAYKRLTAFNNKLEKIEKLNSESISPGSSTSTVSGLLKAKEKEEIIRNFDPYEQFLYYASGSIPYSASVFYTDDTFEYHATGSWPKQSDGTVYSPYSSVALNWLDTQLGIAERYDANNPNYLVLNLPRHIQEDIDSSEFLTLFDMVGHLMDNIKVYVDQFPNIYSTNIDPLKELSMDQVYEVAQSFGLKLPNVYALENLQSFNVQFTGETGSRAYVAETWKRFLHSLVYFNKTKGSRTSFDALLNTYGINSPALQIKETTAPVIENYIRSDELTYGLEFSSASSAFITLPFVSSSLTASTIQLSFNPSVRQNTSIITADSWAIDIVPHPSGSIDTAQYIDGTYIVYDKTKSLTYGRIHVVTGSNRTVIASSSYFPLFSDDYTSIMLRSQSGDISIIQTDGDQVLFQESASVNLSSLWNSTQFLYIGGGPASSSINAVAPRSSWTVGALNTSPAFFSRSIDGNAGTRWDTNQFQSAGLIYSVNFNQQLTLVSFTMDTTASPNDYPGTFSISSSLDGITWTPINVISGSTITSYSFASPTLASQLRLRIVNPRTGNYWSIHEFNVSASISASSIKLSNNFDGVIDEIRVWGENISTDDFVAQAYDPGSYYGSTYTSSYSSLYVHIPFSQPLASITQSVTNETPYQNVSAVGTLPATGFSTTSYTRILRSIKQYTPVVGSTIYTNKKVVVVDPPTFNRQFIDNNGTKVLSRINSIKKIEDKQYNSGQNIIYFATSPSDFVNQNIIRSMGVVDVNNIIGSPRYITDSEYSSLKNIRQDYVKYFNKIVRPNDYIRFFKDLTEGPAEMADEMVPARGKLLDGIVIESPVLFRNKDRIIRKFAVDGTETKLFERYALGSGSIGVGAYDFDTQINQSVNLLPDTLGFTLPIDAKICMTGSFVLQSSTKPSKLPVGQRALQSIGNSYVTASILNNNSAYLTLESITDTETSVGTMDVGYARNPYYGIPASGSEVQRLSGEENTLTPFYDIPPRSNFSDVGTTTYFHKSNGLYRYDVYTKYKTDYLVKLDTEVDSPIDRLYAPITLLNSGSIPNPPGRDTVTIPLKTYLANSVNNSGVLKSANIFALYGVIGTSGLRIRLYSSPTDLSADASRPFYSPPGINSGVLFDALLDGVSQVFPYTLIQTINSDIYYNIDNTTGTDIITKIDLEYFAYEPANLIPIGYLPRHYKFSRDNGTALKRRNYIGCKITSRKFDRDSPITITVSNASNITAVTDSVITSTVDNTTTNIPTNLGTIKFGGNGQLEVGG